MTSKAKTARKPQLEYTTEPLMIGAGPIVHHLQHVRESEGSAKAIMEGRLMFTVDGVQRLTDTQLDKIAAGHATLRGYSDSGFSYHDEKCAACGGRLPKVVDCNVCEGDGFAPPMADMEHKKAGRR